MHSALLGKRILLGQRRQKLWHRRSPNTYSMILGKAMQASHSPPVMLNVELSTLTVEDSHLCV